MNAPRLKARVSDYGSSRQWFTYRSTEFKVKIDHHVLSTLVIQRKSNPSRDGTTHIVMSPLEFMQRLAALVPRPRLHLIRFHGVLAPNAKLRSEIVPGAEENTIEHEADHTHVQHSSARMSWLIPDGTASLLSSVISPLSSDGYGGRLTIIAAPSTSSGQAMRRAATIRCKSPMRWKGIRSKGPREKCGYAPRTTRSLRPFIWQN
jgi:Putative transposase